MATSIIQSFANWIASTHLSEVLKTHSWVVPTTQSIHILALSVVFVCALIIGLKLIGISHSDWPLSKVIAKHSQLIYLGVVVLLLTGLVLITAEPGRQFGSPAFWIKMGLVIFGLLMTCFMARRVQAYPQKWDGADGIAISTRLQGLLFIFVWVAIAFCGRFIGYT